MTGASKYHLPKGTSADGPDDPAITPESAGSAYSGLRILILTPGEEHALSTGENEFLAPPLNGGCTVAVDGRSFELGGRTDVYSAVTDFAYQPRESQTVISSADGGTYALPSARTEQGGHSARYGRKEDVPVEPRGAGACAASLPGHGRERLRLSGGAPARAKPNVGEGPRHRRAADRRARRDPRGRRGADPRGRHGPSSAAPRYDLYRLDVMAGPGPDRVRLICDDPAHGRVRDTWASQDVDDRLPFGEQR
ncbi:5-deoxy-glucuronate isomerase [Streptomyces sp. NPDC086033]|uniref:5-deoxy-glucuronate isomerase n=1 Tax=Streptomyces sp. NPDC086033 TaxID=3365747 RepID=UPI0037D33607